MKYKRDLKEDETYLPITYQQFEDLTNEMLVYINEMTAPQAVDGNFMAHVIMSVIHSLDRKTVTVSKQDLFDRSINLISNQMTHQACEAMMAKFKAKPLEAVPDLNAMTDSLSNESIEH